VHNEAVNPDELPCEERGETMADEQQSWLVGSLAGQGQQDSLRKVIERFTQDPRTKITEVVGSAEHPDRLVVTMSEQTAKEFQQEFGDDIHIEPNADLQLNG